MSREPEREPAPFVCIAGGGTAGHVQPGLAVARALVARGHAPDEVLFVGAERGIETTLVPEAGFPLVALPGRGLQRRLTLANLGAIGGLLVGAVRALRLLRRRRPRVVLALGGYASVACVLAAKVWRIPVVVAEQNARAGAANRLAGRRARACAVPFEATDLPRAVVTGNPVRPEILAVAEHRDRAGARDRLGIPEDRVLLAVFAGSLGSRRINEAVVGLARRWVDRADVAIHHVVGSRDFAALAAELPATRTDDPGRLWYRAVEYEHHMDQLLAAADLAVCRSGGTTVAELAAVGVASVLVPLPIAPRDHQTANAAPLVAAGAAVPLADGDTDADHLEAVIDELLATPGRLAEMGRHARTLGRPDAADRVADLLEEHARDAR